jgi:hypothetical protein
MKPTKARRVDSVGGITFGVLVAVLAANPLIAPGTKGPAAVLWGRSVPSQKNATDIAGLSGMVQRPIKFVHGVGSKRVPHFRSIEGDPNRSAGAGAMVCDVGEIEA